MSGHQSQGDTNFKTANGKYHSDAYHSGVNDNYYISQPYRGQCLMVDIEPGQKLKERFTIKRCIGIGSSGRVYLASDDMRSNSVALKVVAVDSGYRAEDLKREVELNSKVFDYHHIIKVFDIHCTLHRGTYLLLISMEYADGGSLRKWLGSYEDNLQKRCCEGPNLLKQIGCGLGALHNVGIVHQDLKPENLLFVNNVLKVSDLGLSKHFRAIGSNINRSKESQFGRGTPVYMSPEQFTSAHPDDIDHRSDIYSLGIITFEMLHRQCRPPFGGSFEELRDRHLNISAPPLQDANVVMTHIISRCLEKDPTRRYSSISQIIDELEGRGRTCADEPVQESAESQRLRQVDDLWEKSRRCYEDRDFGESGRLCSQILALCGQHEDAKRMLDDLQGRFQQGQRFYQTIERGIGYKSMEELMALLVEAVDIYPNHPDGKLVQTQLLTLARQYDHVMYMGKAALSRGHWELAQANFDKARQINPGSPALAHVIEFVTEVRMQIESARSAIDSALEQGNRRKALFLARAIDRYVGQIKGLTH